MHDPDKEPYEEMIGRHKALQARKEAEAEAATRPPQAGTPTGYWKSHPGFGEAMIPVWGSAREAIADAYEGDVVGAVGNGVLAVTDIALPGTFVAKGMTKGVFKGGSHTWNATRKWMGKNGMLEPGQHGHHGIVPRGGWGARVPEKMKNQPWNITKMPSAEVHGRIHGRYGGKPQYSLPERYVRGIPNWLKATHGVLGTRGATVIDSQHER